MFFQVGVQLHRVRKDFQLSEGLRAKTALHIVGRKAPAPRTRTAVVICLARNARVLAGMRMNSAHRVRIFEGNEEFGGACRFKVVILDR